MRCVDKKALKSEKINICAAEQKLPLTRTESDFLGSREVPLDAYYGIQTIRAQENFSLTGVKIHSKLIKSMGFVKYACTEANIKTGSLPDEIGQAIKQACLEFIEGKFDDHIIVDSIQGGAGTSINMNVNEVLANRAIEILGGQKGCYEIVSPNSHVNMSQSTNDVVPTAFKVAVLMMKDSLLTPLEQLYLALKEKETEYDEIVVIGRTHLQDAVPIRFGQRFGTYARFIESDLARIQNAINCLLTVNLGATAVGTGLNADPLYVDTAIAELRKITGFDIIRDDYLMYATQNTDCYVHISGALRICALNISKMANDLRMSASGPICGFNEIDLPMLQPGSSIMPGKVNPVMPEVMNQICFQIQGNDLSIALASGAGQFELNVMGPVIMKNLFESIDLLINGVQVLTTHCIKGIKVNAEHCKLMVNNSIGLVTALIPYIGYEMSAEIAKEALASRRSVQEIALEKNCLTKEELEIILQPRALTEPGIVGGQLMKNKADKSEDRSRA